MKLSYTQTLRNPSSSGRYLESKETGKVSDAEVMSSDQDDGPSVDVKLEPVHKEMASRKETHKTLTGEQTEERKGDEAFHSPQSHSRMKIKRISHPCEQIQMWCSSSCFPFHRAVS
ncbi:unnamed protein product [Coregonus sp. 'balchen']|nr:unnamed protein product [Coregonus sp. 'balchen']